MPVPVVIGDLSQVAASNFPAGSDSPSNLDDVQRAQASFIALLRDGKGLSTPVTLASAATTDIGAQNSAFVEISGTTGITSFGTTYNGPRFLRFTGALLLTNSASLALPGAANIATVAGDTCIACPNSASSGWNVISFQRAASLTNGAIAAGAITTSGLTQSTARLLGRTTAATGPVEEISVGTGLSLSAGVLSGSSISIPKRGSVLSGATTRIAIGTGLAVNLLATTTNVSLAFAQGLGTSGAVDKVGTLTADALAFWSGLTANVVNYLFYDRNSSTGAITGVASTLPYIAQDSTVAISVVNGQHTYVYDIGQMYVGNGSVATAVDRVPEGECLAGAASITTVTSYAKQRQSVGAWVATLPAAGTPISTNPNLGTNLFKCELELLNTTTNVGYLVGDIAENVGQDNGSPITIWKTRNSAGFTVGNSGVFAATNRSGGGYIALTAANWSYRLVSTGRF